MHTLGVTTQTLDRVLALQFLVAWAGETAEEPRRLGWWHSDLIDPLGGGDFFRRLLPRTHQWAALEATRKIAEAVDQRPPRPAQPGSASHAVLLGLRDRRAPG